MKVDLLDKRRLTGSNPTTDPMPNYPAAAPNEQQEDLHPEAHPDEQKDEVDGGGGAEHNALDDQQRRQHTLKHLRPLVAPVVQWGVTLLSRGPINESGAF